jgi:integrase
MEIGNLRRLWIDREAKTISFPAEAMKNDREHLLPLSDAAWAVLETAPQLSGEDRLFPSRNSKSDKSASGFSKAKRQLDEATGIQDWVFHDIRRTVATQMNAIGVRDTTVDRVLSHTIPGVSGVYNKHQYLEEKRDALERWAARLLKN